MRIEIWSDVVCPWCYLGKRRLEHALAGFEHADEVEVVYRSFELDPTSPERATERVADWLAARYGTDPAGARQMQQQVTDLAAAEGLTYDLEHTLRGRTLHAHRLLHLALTEHGTATQAALVEALMAAYFTRAEDLTDRAVLRAAATSVGLPLGRVDAVLGSLEFADAVEADIAQARAFGAGGVPFFVADRAVAVSGAQPLEVFSALLEQAWSGARAGA